MFGILSARDSIILQKGGGEGTGDDVMIFCVVLGMTLGVAPPMNVILNLTYEE